MSTESGATQRGFAIIFLRHELIFVTGWCRVAVDVAYLS